jgi:hypothetical protein
LAWFFGWILCEQDINEIHFVAASRREHCGSGGKALPCYLFARKFTRGAGVRLLDLAPDYAQWASPFALLIMNLTCHRNRSHHHKAYHYKVVNKQTLSGAEQVCKQHAQGAANLGLSRKKWRFSLCKWATFGPAAHGE